MFGTRITRAVGYLSVAAIVGFLPAQGQAQSWNEAAAGTYIWNVNNNPPWSTGTFPNSTSAIANVNNDILGNQNIDLNQLITLNQLNLGDSTLSGGVYHEFRIFSGPGGSFAFADPGSSTPQITSQNGANLILAPIVVTATTEIRPTSIGLLALSGGISGAGGLTHATNGVTLLGGTNTYAGLTTISAGTVFVNGSLTLSGSGVSVAAGAIVAGAGSMSRQLTVSGMLAPGSAAGVVSTLTTSADVSFVAGSIFSVQLGNIAGLSDRIDLSNRATAGLSFTNASLDVDRNSVSGFVEGSTYQYVIAALSTSGNPPNRLVVNGATVAEGTVIGTATWNGASWDRTGNLTINPLGFDILGIGTTLTAQRLNAGLVLSVTPAPEPVGLLALASMFGLWRGRGRILSRLKSL